VAFEDPNERNLVSEVSRSERERERERERGREEEEIRKRRRGKKEKRREGEGSEKKEEEGRREDKGRLAHPSSAQASTKEVKTYGSGDKEILIVDCGMKLNQLRCFLKRGVRVKVGKKREDITKREENWTTEEKKGKERKKKKR
jgi:carbamoylphosphate synthase small subunit